MTVSPPRSGWCSARRLRTVLSVVYASRQPFDPGMRANRLREQGRAASYVEGLWSPSLIAAPENRTLKHTLIRSAIFRLTRRGSFSLRRGLGSF
ncbi:MAG: hypothetical protein QOH73_439 [Gaiellaceae bacterium]|nr:hypothetical protein [Gaiellaceae bacterium]